MSDDKITQILVVGPLPPPLAGTSVSFQLFCNEVNRHPDKVRIKIINSAPNKLDGRTKLFTFSNLFTVQHILWNFCQRIKRADQVIIFGSNQFLLSMATVCICIAKIVGKPTYVRPFGGSLDRYYCELPRILRWLFRQALSRANGLIVQTELLYVHFSSLIGDKVYLVPGYRSMSCNGSQNDKKKFTRKLRLVFLGHVREEKGIFTLLETLRSLSTDGNGSVRCDIFGPIYPSISTRFKRELATTKNATYKGVITPDQVVHTLSQYHALIFPTHYQGEGHPGVVIEAIMAGIAVVTTAFRSIPEVIQDRVNGLLVPPQDPQSLMDAIGLIDNDRQLLVDMTKRNSEMRTRYSSAGLVPLILRPMGINLESPGEKPCS
jgi:glycosyltransferase involved in cell wall biosynthesis